ncbi:MAG: S8 family serine peptidase [Caldilineaceae bacterium]
MKSLMNRPLCITLLLLLLTAFCADTSSSAYAADPPKPLDASTSPRVSVLVELSEPSVVQIYTAMQRRDMAQAAQTSAATKAQLATLEQMQQRLLGALAKLEAQVLYRNQRVYNGIAIRIAADKVAELSQLPDVKAVHRLVAKRPDAEQYAPLSGAPVLWQGVNGLKLTGQGIKLAIIDTGVDYLHTDLGGPGVGYNVNDPTKSNDIPGFPNAKVIGGYDFAGDHYDADEKDSTFQPTPAPDPDPLDCYAHGTHVAGIAAGSGVNPDGTTYPGPYSTAIDLNSLKIPPGAAPQAQIYALKVFGCTGSSEIVDQGIEWAIDPNQDGDLSDHVDVINLSLGSPYGSAEDPTVLASESAAAAGVIVVASAGNSGDVTYVTGSPAIADDVISVAAAQIGGTGFETLAGFSARGPRRIDTALKPDLTAPGYRITSAALGTGNGSLINSGTSMASPHVAGAMALLRQLHPTWSVTELKALVMNSATPEVRTNETITATLYSPTRIGAGQLALEKAQQTDVLAYNAEQPSLVSVSFGAPEVLTNALALKNIRIANKSDGEQRYNASYSGVTDMPGVAFQAPTQVITVPAAGFANVPILFTADAAQMRHTRDQTQATKQGGQARQWLSEETGYLLFWPASNQIIANLTGANAVPAVNTSVQGKTTFAYNPQTHTLTYTLEISGTPVLTQTGVTLNRGLLNGKGVVAAILASGDLFAGQVYSGAVTLEPKDDLLLRDGLFYVNLTTPAFPNGLLRGAITTTAAVLSVPLYAAPRPAAAMQATTPSLDFTQNPEVSQSLSWQGTGIQGSNPPTDVVSLVSAVGLQWSSPDLPPANPITGTEGSRTDLYDHADLKYLGVTSNYGATRTAANPAGAVTQSTIYFGLATYGHWATPNEVRFAILIDTNHDGVNDFRLFNCDQLGYNSDSITSDAFVTALENLHTGFVSPQAPLNGVSATTKDTALYNTNVMLLPVAASALGLTDANPAFDYYVESYSNDRTHAQDGSERYVDRSPHLHFDVAHSGLDLTNGQLGAPLYQDLAGEQITVGFDLAAYTQNNLKGILLLHHHNITGQQAEVVAVDYNWPNTLYLPLVKK